MCANAGLVLRGFGYHLKDSNFPHDMKRPNPRRCVKNGTGGASAEATMVMNDPGVPDLRGPDDRYGVCASCCVVLWLQ